MEYAKYSFESTLLQLPKTSGYVFLMESLGPAIHSVYDNDVIL